MRQGISIRQFAKLDHCDERLVRRALKNGWLRAYKDGSLNPKLAGTGWRRTNRKRVENVRAAAEESADDASVEAAADRLVRTRGLLKNALAALRELQLAREVGSAVEVGAVVTEKARDHAIVRNLMLGLGSKLAPGLALMADPEQIKVAIDDEVDRAFEVLHRGGGDAD